MMARCQASRGGRGSGRGRGGRGLARGRGVEHREARTTSFPRHRPRLSTTIRHPRPRSTTTTIYCELPHHRPRLRVPVRVQVRVQVRARQPRASSPSPVASSWACRALLCFERRGRGAAGAPSCSTEKRAPRRKDETQYTHGKHLEAVSEARGTSSGRVDEKP